MEALIFWILAGGAALSAAAVVLPPFGRNPLYAALSLIVCFFFLAGLYVSLAASFLAAMQILVYAGAIMVLFVFAILLLNLRRHELGEARITIIKVLSGLAVLFIFVRIGRLFLDSVGDRGLPPLADPDFGSAGQIADHLFRQFLLPFELTSILLLIAVIGAVAIARNKFGRGVDP